MSYDTKHPLYTEHRAEWVTMRDTVLGQKKVKSEGTEYLPMPSGFAHQPDGGKVMYGAYIMRAQFPEIVDPTIRGMAGIIHGGESKYELPSQMEFMRERATLEGHTLEMLHARTTVELLTQGRYGLFADAPAGGAGFPYITGYSAETIINWSRDRTLFVVDESDYVRSGFEWTKKLIYRALEIEDGAYRVNLYTDGQKQDFSPRPRGGGQFAEVPFVIANAVDLDVDPIQPPLMGLANSALALYRLDADYRYQLFMTGQETLIFTGMQKEDLPAAVGAGIAIPLPEGGDAKYVGVSGTGISLTRQAILDERAAAVAYGARIMDSSEKAGVESEGAMKLRHAASTATLRSIAKVSAAALEQSLRHIAVFVGADPAGVRVSPNLDFLDSPLTPGDAATLVGVWQSRAISYETLYENLQAGGIASADRDHEEERRLIDEEPELDEPPGIKDDDEA